MSGESGELSWELFGLRAVKELIQLDMMWKGCGSLVSLEIGGPQFVCVFIYHRVCGRVLTLELRQPKVPGLSGQPHILTKTQQRL